MKRGGEAPVYLIETSAISKITSKKADSFEEKPVLPPTEPVREAPVQKPGK